MPTLSEKRQAVLKRIREIRRQTMIPTLMFTASC